MIRIWAKTVIDDERITRDKMVEIEGTFKERDFNSYLTEVCYRLDIPTPVTLKHHPKNFNKFNIVRFKKTEFIESVDFEALVLENASE